jgi:hypothetical protein
VWCDSLIETDWVGSGRCERGCTPKQHAAVNGAWFHRYALAINRALPTELGATGMKSIPTTSANQPAAAWLSRGRFALLLGLLVLATFPGVLLGGGTFVVRDFGLFSYPVAYFQRESFWRGELPFWNPLSSCGIPFLAQWNTMALYPPALIYLLLPLTWSLPFFCLAHLFWGGLGMYLLAHRWTNDQLAAALAGVIFAFNGLALNFLIWPSHAATLGWAPWVIWLAQRAWLEGGKQVAWAALAGAMQMLAGGPETILLTWVVLLVLACGDGLRRKGTEGRVYSGASEVPKVTIFLRFLTIALLVALICAAQLLPFLALLARSQRDVTYGSSYWAMPIWGWANFLVPLFRAAQTPQGFFLQPGQNWTSSYYAGMAAVALGAAAVWRAKDSRARLIAVLMLAGLVLALGDRGLLYHALRVCFPALGFARFPVKFVILVLLLAPLLAAFGWAALVQNENCDGAGEGIAPAPSSANETRWSHRYRVDLIGVLTILLLIGAILWLGWRYPSPGSVWRATWQNGLSRAGFLVLLAVLAGASLRARGQRRILLSCLLLAACWLDLVSAVPSQNPSVQPGVYTPGWTRTQANWNPQPRLGESRVMMGGTAQQAFYYYLSPELDKNYLLYRLATKPDCNLLDDVPQVHGFYSLTPREVYDVSFLPYFHPRLDFKPLLDFLSVSHITAPGTTLEWTARPTALPMVTCGQQPLFADDQTAFNVFVQTNLDLRQSVFLPLEARGEISAVGQPAARVHVTEFANQRISFGTESPGPSLVVVSQTFYPAWKAYVDGQPVKIWRANYAFQALQVPAGRHEVRLRYQDRPFVAGGVISCIGALSCLIVWLKARKRSSKIQGPIHQV